MNKDSRRFEQAIPIVAVLAIVCLLVSFHQVVRSAVLRGQAWRNATALHAEDAMRCIASGDRPVRERCLVQLNASLRDGPMLQAGEVATPQR